MCSDACVYMNPHAWVRMSEWVCLFVSAKLYALRCILIHIVEGAELLDACLNMEKSTGVCKGCGW